MKLSINGNWMTNFIRTQDARIVADQMPDLTLQQWLDIRESGAYLTGNSDTGFELEYER